MSEDNGFILKAEMYNQEEWYQMYLSMLKVCKELQQENQELKKQLKPNYYVKGLEGTLKEYQQTMTNYENQQKEFIEWLENEITQYGGYTLILYKEILSKFKEIIGVLDER